MAIQHFSQLQVWQISRRLVVKVYKATNKFPSTERFGLISQIQRSIVSVPSNIAEGFSRKTKLEKVQFYSIALGSLAETESHLYLALDLGYINEAEFNDFQQSIIESRKLTHGLMNSATDRPLKYTKHQIPDTVY
jgi:four helix bundle protein